MGIFQPGEIQIIAMVKESSGTVKIFVEHNAAAVGNLIEETKQEPEACEDAETAASTASFDTFEIVDPIVVFSEAADEKVTLPTARFFATSDLARAVCETEDGAIKVVMTKEKSGTPVLSTGTNMWTYNIAGIPISCSGIVSEHARLIQWAVRDVTYTVEVLGSDETASFNYEEVKFFTDHLH